MHRTWRGRGRFTTIRSALVFALVASSCAVGGAAEQNSNPPVDTTVVASAEASLGFVGSLQGVRAVEGGDGVPPFSGPIAGGEPGAPDKDPLEPALEPPRWLGLIELLPRAQSAGPRPTPLELTNRQFPTPPGLDPPTTDGYVGRRFSVTDEIIARSSWSEACPVTPDELAYIQVTHWGFDGERHTGEILLNAAAAEDMIDVFEKLYDAQYPIESMRVKNMDDMTKVATGDDNVTSSFECRRSVTGRRWSEHAFGTAIDINPFQNPYLKGNIVIPHLAEFYTDRSLELPGMIQGNDMMVQAFDEIGWSWGGDWSNLKDWMHFSAGGT